MSIDFRNLNGHRQLPGQGAPADAAREGGGGPATERTGSDAADRTAATDKVELSSGARNLRSLAESVESSNGIDAARVERIRQEIAEGRYHVDAGKLAGRMIDLEQALLG